MKNCHLKHDLLYLLYKQELDSLTDELQPLRLTIKTKIEHTIVVFVQTFFQT